MRDRMGTSQSTRQSVSDGVDIDESVPRSRRDVKLWEMNISVRKGN